MKAEKIAGVEARFDLDGLDSQGFSHKMTAHSCLITDDLALRGHENTLNYIDASLQSGDDSYYCHDEINKDQIVLHYTIGYLPGDIATLTTSGSPVSTPFVIGQNGTIYNLFPSKYWAYHLGRGAQGGNTRRSQRTIAIELSNIGPLVRKGDNLHTVYGDIYCSLLDNERYCQQNYRGFEYFARLTDPQYQSLAILLRYLCARHQIPRRFLDETERYDSFAEVANFKGIVSHANYRSTGKSDIGPGFEWNRVMQASEAKTESLTKTEMV